MNENRKRSLSIKGKILYVALLLMYLAASVMLPMISRAGGMLVTPAGPIPFVSFTGVLSCLANICIIFLAVYYRKQGFLTALILLLLQFPLLLKQFIFDHNLSAMPGAFTNILTLVAIIMIYRRNKAIDAYQKVEVDYLKDQQKISWRLFEQTATALVNAIDAKDTYSHGHSLRVAEYSEKIARALGCDEEECRKVYYAALLHDVGKIGIPDQIINKKGKLTDEEFDVIKQHPGVGAAILSGIDEYPYLSIGAHFHHERYDGKGYPARLKGEDIPRVARIISVADAYDAMSSNRSYRKAIPQQLVREEIVKGAGTQFDPEMAKIMQHLIDLDTEYQMKEKVAVSELAGKSELLCGDFRSEISDGIVITQNITKICLSVTKDADVKDGPSGLALLLFDSLDGRYHNEAKTVRELCYYEYCEIWPGDHVTDTGVRKIQTRIREKEDGQTGQQWNPNSTSYEIEAVKYKDHALVRFDDGITITEVTIALPDSSRYVYAGLTGAHCRIHDVKITKEDFRIDSAYIPRIAEEISYIQGKPEGDLPNIQIDGHRSDATAGVPLKKHLELRFHTMSLPTARLVWHCPYVVVFASDDGTVNGEHYREFALVRPDGENWEYESVAKNSLTVRKQPRFAGWDVWKSENKAGFDCSVRFVRNGGTITMTTENLGISIENVTTILDGSEDIYVALTGDQCALTDIKVIKE